MAVSVLVVAEEIELRRVLVADLMEQGLTVNVAPTVPDALRILRASPIPVVARFDYQVLDVVSLDVLPTIVHGGPVLQRHLYVMVVLGPVSAEEQALVSRLGVDTLEVPYGKGELTQTMMDAVHELDERLAIDAQADVQESEARERQEQQESRDSHQSQTGSELAR